MAPPLRIPRITKLRLPPRRVPLGLWCQAAMDPAALFWAAALACSLLYILLISGDGTLRESLSLRLWGVEAPAGVESVEPTSMSVGGGVLARITYSFRHPAGTQRVATHDFASHWKPGGGVRAVYLPQDPSVARLRGERRAHAGVFGASLYLFPLAALLFGVPAWRRAWLAALLLREGMAAEGHIQSSRRLRRGLRSYDLYRYDYEFESLWGEVFAGSAVANLDLPARGAPPHAGLVTKFPPGSAPKRSVLYLPRDATVSTLVDALPLHYRLQVDGRGEWVSGSSLSAISLVALVALLLIAALTCIWLSVAGLLPDLGR